MKIAVLDFSTNTVDIITVEQKWLEKDLREALPEWYTDEAWKDVCENEDELIDHFLFTYCNYNPDNIQYMVNFKEVTYFTPKEIG